MKNKRFSHTFARSLATKRTLVCLLIVAVLVPVMVVAEEPWNGLVKTDMASMAATRDVSQSKVIPAPELPFGGIIKKNVYDSTAWWPPMPAPKKGSPNVLLLLIDDEGFGAPSTFGGQIPTPISDKLAQEGLRYVNFHTTSLCSPTRAALITGRNHGAVGFEQIAELSTGFPGYDGTVGKKNATIARILQANGYATAWFGKDHNVPLDQMTEAGPKDQWPIGMGFDYFYGFLGGDMDQWHPTIWENVNQIFPDVGHPGYNLNIDIADKAISWVQRVNSLKPDQPVFLYYCPGATHAPHQPTPEWIAKFKGKFDNGWDAYREEVFKRQQSLGIIPKSAKLTPWPDESTKELYPGISLKHWNELTPYQRKAFAHEMEVYAAYLAETDYQIGRVIQAFKDTGRYDNTLIIYIHGDNGASAEGTPEGTPSEVADFNTFYPTVEEYGPKYLDKWGSEYTDPHYPVGWAWALDTPFKWSKQVAPYFGGTRNGMVISWPGHVNDPGAIRYQFHHVIDIVPTILQACGIVEPEMVDGVQQKPIEGVSLAYTFDKANAKAPSTHHSQYFEMFGAMGMYKDGWIASTDPFAIPWLLLSNKPKEDVWSSATWRLYHVTEDDDWTQYTDVKDKNPDKLKELQDLFVAEASKNNIFPLNNSPLAINPRTSLIGDRSTTVYRPGIVALDTYDTPNVLNNDYSIEGEVTVKADGGNGVIVANGGRFGGYSLWVNHGVPMFSYNVVMMDLYRWKGKEKLTPGTHKVRFSFVYDGGGFGKGGVGTLSVDGQTVDTHRVPKTICCTLCWFEGLDVGADYSTPVDEQYKVPHKFTGTLSQVVFNNSPMKLTAEEKADFYQRLAAARRAIQ